VLRFAALCGPLWHQKGKKRATFQLAPNERDGETIARDWQVPSPAGTFTVTETDARSSFGNGQASPQLYDESNFLEPQPASRGQSSPECASFFARIGMMIVT
jgi:hypothetical protein